MSGYPTLESCDQSDPKSAFQWAFVALPFSGSTPLMVQDEVRPEWSALFHDLGFRHHPELQTKKVQMPFRGQQNTMNGAVRVVGIDEPDADASVIQDPAALTAFEQEMQLERYRQIGRIGGRDAESDGAAVWDDFNPADHTVSYVCGYLHRAPIAVKRRVIAAEQLGKKRQGILNRFRGI
ncbi:phage gene 29 protein family protein [Antrihabitans cavernicola]|uniref:DUF2744 domain-containing protein n=1 Tax=Antrihabitans cavernicola TaxID=2495913 RepID=A0A5A7S4M9_9NOCA|nr:DUF2744 domain-containing protein [Spelaeibacter cavernicola]KAA0016751.1 DUF2744 domain-containing protein [Spelaeibacter cavernicola]